MASVSSVPPRFKWVSPALLAGAGLVASTVVTPPTLGTPAGIGSYTLFHAIGYSALAVATAYALGPSRMTGRTRLLAVCVGPIAFGVAAECLQLLQSGRTPSLGDAAVNAVGVLAAACAWYALSVYVVVAAAERGVAA